MAGDTNSLSMLRSEAGADLMILGVAPAPLAYGVGAIVTCTHHVCNIGRSGYGQLTPCGVGRSTGFCLFFCNILSQTFDTLPTPEKAMFPMLVCIPKRLSVYSPILRGFVLKESDP